MSKNLNVVRFGSNKNFKIKGILFEKLKKII
jgi:hypothetical protein